MFVLGLIALLLALVAALVAARTGEPGRRRLTRTAAGAGALLATALVLISCLSTVPTRNVGIVTSFQKPTGRTTGAGLQWTAPWQDVDDWDASGQTFSHLGDNCVWLTIAAQRRACIPVQIEWSAKAEEARRRHGLDVRRTRRRTGRRTRRSRAGAGSRCSWHAASTRRSAAP